MKKRIFYIDDDPDILEAVQIILEHHGFDVYTATDLIALDDIITFHPDIILLDLLLRGKSGKDIAKQIKEIHTLKDIPVIIFSAHTLTQIQNITKTYNAAGYLQKPFDIDLLIETINKHLK